MDVYCSSNTITKKDSVTNSSFIKTNSIIKSNSIILPTNCCGNANNLLLDCNDNIICNLKIDNSNKLLTNINDSHININNSNIENQFAFKISPPMKDSVHIFTLIYLSSAIILIILSFRYLVFSFTVLRYQGIKSKLTNWNLMNQNKNNNIREEDSKTIKSSYVSDTVINLSDHTLTDAQITLLSKGLKFCPTPGEPEQGDLWRDLQKFHRSLRLKAMFSKPNMPWSDNTKKTENSQNLIIDIPFKNARFKLPSTWNPPGPKDLEHYIST